MAPRRYTRRKRGGGTRRTLTKITKKVVKRVLNSNLEEKYYLATLYNGTASAATWQLTSALAGLQQGTSATQRVGNRVTVKRIEYSIFIQPATTMSGAGSLCRVILYHNRQAAGAQIGATTIFDTNDLYSLRNITQSKRVSVTRDAQYPMWPTALNGSFAVAATSPPIRLFWRQPVNKMVTYQSNAGTISDILTDDYGIGFVSDDANCCAVSVNAKIIFTDD